MPQREETCVPARFVLVFHVWYTEEQTLRLAEDLLVEPPSIPRKTGKGTARNLFNGTSRSSQS